MTDSRSLRMRNVPMVGDVWKDRGGTHFTVEKVLPDGGAIVLVDGLRHPLQAASFKRARLVVPASTATQGGDPDIVPVRATPVDEKGSHTEGAAAIQQIEKKGEGSK